ncbi:MAG: hypothetical protein HY007_01250 [Candidatus Sungbacteria bacterium]|nr:hypothetical protein [Candidatus Sungbacteria bacterium]
MKIKDLPQVDRPREKLEKYGPERLSDSELLAILLRTGSKGINVVELSSKILRKFSGVGLAKASVKDLSLKKNMCEHTSCFSFGPIA